MHSAARNVDNGGWCHGIWFTVEGQVYVAGCQQKQLVQMQMAVRADRPAKVGGPINNLFYM